MGRPWCICTARLDPQNRQMVVRWCVVYTVSVILHCTAFNKRRAWVLSLLIDVKGVSRESLVGETAVKAFLSAFYNRSMNQVRAGRSFTNKGIINAPALPFFSFFHFMTCLLPRGGKRMPQRKISDYLGQSNLMRTRIEGTCDKWIGPAGRY